MCAKMTFFQNTSGWSSLITIDTPDLRVNQVSQISVTVLNAGNADGIAELTLFWTAVNASGTSVVGVPAPTQIVGPVNLAVPAGQSATLPPCAWTPTPQITVALQQAIAQGHHINPGEIAIFAKVATLASIGCAGIPAPAGFNQNDPSCAATAFPFAPAAAVAA